MNNSDTSLNMNKDGPQTHEEAVEFVKHIFQIMGGTVTEMPPERPNKGCRYTLTTERGRDNFLCDFESSCLINNWDNSIPFPTGPKRFENPEWAKMIKSQVFPAHSDVDFFEYCDWCEAGGGDEWFQEDEQ